MSAERLRMAAELLNDSETTTDRTSAGILWAVADHLDQGWTEPNGAISVAAIIHAEVVLGLRRQ